VNWSRFGIGPNTALSKENDCASLENVKDFCSTLVRLRRASAPFPLAILCANRNDGLVLAR